MQVLVKSRDVARAETAGGRKKLGLPSQGGRHGRFYLDRLVVGADFSLLAGLRPNGPLNFALRSLQGDVSR
jgi:hypothetical protein